MDIINQKLPQLQELFVDQLGHYHAHLVKMDEEGAALSGLFGFQVWALSSLINQSVSEPRQCVIQG